MRPSLKALENAFPGKGRTLRKLLTENTAVREHSAAIARVRECHHMPTMPDLRMHALNSELECFGVEFVQGKGRSRSFQYLNAGDVYNTTIIRFIDGCYRIATVGDIIERGNYV